MKISQFNHHLKNCCENKLFPVYASMHSDAENFSATTALSRGGSLIFFIIGDILRVVPRLEARYDWQPMPFRTLVKHEKTRLRYVHNPCHHAPKAKRIKTAFKEVALVSSDEDCSTFQKVYITMHACRYTNLERRCEDHQNCTSPHDGCCYSIFEVL